MENRFFKINFDLFDDEIKTLAGDFRFKVKSPFTNFYFWLSEISIREQLLNYGG